MRIQISGLILAMALAMPGIGIAAAAESEGDVYKQQHLIATLMQSNVANMHQHAPLTSPESISQGQASPAEETPVTSVESSVSESVEAMTPEASPEIAPMEPAVQPSVVSEAPVIPSPVGTPVNRQAAMADTQLKEPQPMVGARPLPADEKLFRMGPGDEIQVTVWGYPELSEKVVILPDGTISYPLLGTFVASGFTVGELSVAMQSALEKQIRSPQVNVSIVQMRGRRFSITGDVRQAGTYPLWGEQVMVLEGIAQAGGWNPTALLEEAKIYRVAQDSSTQVVEMDLRELLNNLDGSYQPMLQPGDVVHIPSQANQRKVCVLGQVARPGLYPLTRDMTVVEALSAAGWVQNSAGMKSVIVARRKDDGDHQFYTLNIKDAVKSNDFSQHLPLMPGDIVFVPEKFISKMAGIVRMFTSTVEPAANSYLRVYDATDPATVLISR